MLSSKEYVELLEVLLRHTTDTPLLERREYSKRPFTDDVQRLRIPLPSKT